VTALDDAREHLTATIWEVLGAYTPAPRVHHADMIHSAADRYAHALAGEIADETLGPRRLNQATAEYFSRRTP